MEAELGETLTETALATLPDIAQAKKNKELKTRENLSERHGRTETSSSGEPAQVGQ
jgi:hypothetical protein